jgi:hypothetical protein
MAPKLITMLTYNDETVNNALSIFRECADLDCDFWGFKDVGLPEDRIKELVTVMKQAGKTTFLEVVSLTEEECLRGARIAVECGFDYLMGTVFFQSVFDYLKSHAKHYLPFCGKVTGHPSVVEGTIEDAIDEGKRLQKLEVAGFDLLAYRFVGDAEELARRFVKEIDLPVVIAGSIASTERLDRIKEYNPWAFTIGTAFFDKKFVPDGSFGDQIQAVLEYLNE